MNALLAPWATEFALPPFAEIHDADFSPAFDAALDQARANIAQIAGNSDAPTFANTIEALELAEGSLDRVAGVFYNLAGADSTHAREALQRAGLTIDDIDLFEVNEAFASVVLRFMQAFNVSHDKVNVNGGSIALGHPLGATGAIIIGTLLDELERRDLSTGLATLCIASGMGAATIIERV